MPTYRLQGILEIKDDLIAVSRVVQINRRPESRLPVTISEYKSTSQKKGGVDTVRGYHLIID